MHQPETTLLKKIATRIIAVGAEGGAAALFPVAGAAFAAGTPGIGLLILGAWAALLAAKNEAVAASAAETQAGVEAFLTALVAQQKSLRKAIESLDTDQHMHELVSRERAAELRKLIQSSSAVIDERVAEHQELVFVVAKFIEGWSERTDTRLEKIDSQLDEFVKIEAQIRDGFERVLDGQAVSKEQLDRLERKLDSALLPQTEVPVATSGLVGEDVIDLLAKRLLDASTTLLNWGTTVGAGRHHITPDAERSALAALEKRTSSNLILGAKGSGKSALSASICASAIRSGFVILAIKADKIPADVGTDEALRKHLNLPVAPRDALRLLAARRKTLLVVDQLDSVSELIDRRSERLNVLLNLIRDVSGTPNLHILAACREFDFQHDARLSTIPATELRLTPTPWEVVQEIVKAEGYVPEAIGEAMRELLGVPWNLNMFLRVANRGDAYASMQALIEAVWKKWVIDPDGPSDRVNLVEQIAQWMSKHEELFVPAALADEFPAARDALLRDEIIVSESSGRALAFRHQTFYDYTLARLFARGTRSLSQHVLDHQDGLFVRPVMLSGLELLRDTSRTTYHAEVARIFEASPRPHLRGLLIEYIAQQKSPDDAEARIGLSLISGEDGPLIFRSAAGSLGWFDRLRNSGDLSRWMKRPPNEAALCINLLISALAEKADAVLQLVSDHWSADAQYDRLVDAIAHHVPAWNARWAEMVCEAIRRSRLQGTWMAERVVKDNPKIAVGLVRAQFDRELEDARRLAAEEAAKHTDDGDDDVKRYVRARNNPLNQLISTQAHDRTFLEGIADSAPREFLEAIWPWFLDVVGEVGERFTLGNSYRDDYSTWGAYEMSPMPLIQSLHAAADGWARKDPDGFVAFAKAAASTELLAGHRILAQALAIVAAKMPTAVLEYLLTDQRRFVVGTYRNYHRFSEALITAVSPHLGGDEHVRLQNAVMAFEMFPRESYAERPVEIRFDFLKWNREHRLRLLRAFPDQFLVDKAREVKGQEETRFPKLAPWDHEEVKVNSIGPRVTAEEMAKASDDDIFNLFDEMAKRGEYPFSRRPGIPPSRSGGIGAQAGEFSRFAENNPGRTLRMLPRFDSARSDHHACVAAAINGIARSATPMRQVIETIRECDRRGFASEDFREAVASAVEHRAKKGEISEPAVLHELEGWLAGMESPAWPPEHKEVEDRSHRGPIVFRGAGMMFTLKHGRAALFRALRAAYGAKEPAEISPLLRVLRARVGIEKHPGVIAEMLFFADVAFTKLRSIPAATEVFDAFISSCPDVLGEDATIHALAHLAGYFRPDRPFETWLEVLRGREDDASKQAYGELLFLYYARRRTGWADAAIAGAIAAGNKPILAGLCYGAADAFDYAHCRARATDILCAVTETDDPDLQAIVEPALYAAHDGAFLMDEHAMRLIETLCRQPSALRVLGAQLIESIAASAGTRPDFVLAVTRSVLDAVGDGVADLAQPLNAAAGSLTSIAITLHRQPGHRKEGLDLFERLQKLGLREAVAALELLDRRPYQRYSVPHVYRRPRRRRPNPAQTD